MFSIETRSRCGITRYTAIPNATIARATRITAADLLDMLVDYKPTGGTTVPSTGSGNSAEGRNHSMRPGNLHELRLDELRSVGLGQNTTGRRWPDGHLM
jgi:hypothetical protein